VCRDVLQNAEGFEYRGEGAFRNWLYKKALAKICDRQRYWKAQKRDPARETQGPAFAIRSRDGSPSEIVILEEDMERLETAFAQLPPEHQRVVTLAYVVGLSRREIAAEMQRSETAVRSMLHRALARVGFLMSDAAVLGGNPSGAHSAP
jgi:RNA polymerase sigma-70 factor (ECF subfamily)